MTGITRLGLGRSTLDVVRRGIHPGRQRVEVRQKIITVVLITRRRDGHMANRYEIVWALVSLERISANQERGVGGLSLEVRIAGRFTNGYVAAIATCVGNRMAHLTR